MKDMVAWPSTSASYSDSGEGGLFAWMVVPEAVSSGDGPMANVFADNCYVDVSAYLSRPRVMLNRPDVCVSAEGRKLYEPYQHADSWFDHTMEIDRRLKLATDDPVKYRLRRALLGSMGRDDVSVPLLAAVFLGSTCHSLWDEGMSQYFEVMHGDLTQEGRDVYKALRLVYGVPPVLLTFLDT